MNDLQVEQQIGPLQLAGFALEPGGSRAGHPASWKRPSGPAPTRPSSSRSCSTSTATPASPRRRSRCSAAAPSTTRPSAPSPASRRCGRDASTSCWGTPSMRATLWEKHAIPRLRFERSSRALGSTQALLKGEVKGATSLFLEIPEKIRVQATWEFEAGPLPARSGNPRPRRRALHQGSHAVPELQPATDRRILPGKARQARSPTASRREHPGRNASRRTESGRRERQAGRAAKGGIGRAQITTVVAIVKTRRGFTALQRW